MRRKYKQGQSVLTYMVLIGAFAAALIFLRIYLARTLQEEYRQNADVWGEGEIFLGGGRSSSQYSGTSWLNRKANCPEIRHHLKALKKQLELLAIRKTNIEKEIQELEKRKAALEARASELLAQAQKLENVANSVEVTDAEREAMLRDAKILRQTAQKFLDEAAKINEQIKLRQDKLKVIEKEIKKLQDKIQLFQKNNPDCF